MTRINETCSVSFADHEAATAFLREFTGTQGGITSVNWYALREKIAEKIAITRAEERERCRTLPPAAAADISMIDDLVEYADWGSMTKSELRSKEWREAVSTVWQRIRTALTRQDQPTTNLTPWTGWDKSNSPFSEARHTDAVCYAAFGATWSMEDAATLISFIERTWPTACAGGDSHAE